MQSALRHATRVFVVLGPEHAHSLATAGLDRDDISSWLYEHARLPAGTFRRHFEELAWAEWMKRSADDECAWADAASPGCITCRPEYSQPTAADTSR